MGAVGDGDRDGHVGRGAVPQRVLIVEDSRSDARLVLEALVEAGVARELVTSVGALADALRVLSGQAVDCIILDLALPDAVGLEGVSVMAAAAPGTPIIVVTGRPADSVVYAAMAEGADEYLCKADLAPELLRDLLVRAAQRRRGSDRIQRTRTAASLVLDSIEAPTAALDGSGRIVAVNHAWSAAAAAAGAAPSSTGVGINYLTVCDQAAGPFADGASEAAVGIRAVLHGDIDRFAMDYWCPSPQKERWFSLRVTPTGELGGGAVVTHLDVTDLKLAEQQLQRDEARLHTVFQESSPIFALVDREGVIQHVSEATTRLLACEAHALVGTGVFDNVDRDDIATAMASFAAVADCPGAKERVRLRAIDGDGRWRELDLSIVNLLDDPSVAAIAVTGCDVTEGRLTQIARRLEGRLLQRLPVAVVVTDDRGVVVYWNDVAVSTYGYSPDFAIGRPVAELGIGPAGVAGEEFMTTVMATGRWEGDYEARRADDSTIPIHTIFERVDDQDIAFSGIVGASIDVTDRRRLEAELAFQALHDDLTGLANRRLFVRHLETAIARDLGTGRCVAVLFIDIDDFKGVNDRLGHLRGDEVLRAVGRRISGVLRADDIVARLGGDEFVVCCSDLDSGHDEGVITARIIEALTAPILIDGEAVQVSASVGIALAASGLGAEAVLRNADAAMYAAKVAGRGKIAVFDGAIHEQMRRRHRLAADLELALDNGDIEAFFQPQFALGTGALEGFEALARWTHPDRGAVPPAEFIAVAEEAGIVTRLGRHVLQEACAALASWQQAAPDQPLTVAVNVSPRQLSDPDFPAAVRDAIKAAKVPASRLCLEVTESALVDGEAAARALRSLKTIGVQLAIDDFGTGYSSLSRLHRFPIDYIKIDRSFVEGLCSRAEDAIIVTAVLGLARALGLRSIAEGIEQRAQLNELAAMGCEMGQGYYWSAALAAADALAMVAGREPLEPDSDAIAVLSCEADPITSLASVGDHLVASDPPEVHARLNAAVSRAVRVTRSALNVVSDIAAIEGGSLQLERSPVRLHDVLHDALAFVEVPIDRPVQIDVPDATILADRGRLALAFVNLLDAALKHAPAGSSLILSGQVGEALAVHVIHEDGAVAPEDVALIFHRYRRPARGAVGGGLGLHLARRLVRAHGGEISYHRTPGRDAQFTVELPVSAEFASVHRGRHAVQFFRNDAEIVATVSDICQAALTIGDAVLIVATAAHHGVIESALQTRGVALPPDLYCALDASEMLETILVNGTPNRERFRAIVAPLVQRLASRAPLTVYGEAVDVLCERGDVIGAMRLEELWNELAEDTTFSLLCAYRSEETMDATVLENICAVHPHTAENVLLIGNARRPTR